MDKTSIPLRAIVQALESRAANTDTDWRWRAASAIRECPTYEQSSLLISDGAELTVLLDEAMK
jgi:hypothetical protein